MAWYYAMLAKDAATCSVDRFRHMQAQQVGLMSTAVYCTLDGTVQYFCVDGEAGIDDRRLLQPHALCPAARAAGWNATALLSHFQLYRRHNT